MPSRERKSGNLLRLGHRRFKGIFLAPRPWKLLNSLRSRRPRILREALLGKIAFGGDTSWLSPPPPDNKLAGMMARSGLGIEKLVTSPAEKKPSKLLALTKGLTRWRSTFQIGTLIQKEAALGRFADSKVIDAVLAQK